MLALLLGKAWTPLYMIQFNVAMRSDVSSILRKEAGLISEILTLAALQEGKNVLVDGSLRDAPWYEEYFEKLRGTYPHVRLAIIHVSAPREMVLARASVSQHLSLPSVLSCRN
jgi:hypothetical protein